jgi:hypothetical protein
VTPFDEVLEYIDIENVIVVVDALAIVPSNVKYFKFMGSTFPF